MSDLPVALIPTGLGIGELQTFITQMDEGIALLNQPLEGLASISPPIGQPAAGHYEADLGIQHHSFSCTVPRSGDNQPTGVSFSLHTSANRIETVQRLEVLHGDGTSWNLRERVRADGSNYVAPYNTGVTIAGWLALLASEAHAAQARRLAQTDLNSDTYRLVPDLEKIMSQDAMLLHQRLIHIVAAEATPDLKHHIKTAHICDEAPYPVRAIKVRTRKGVQPFLSPAGHAIFDGVRPKTRLVGTIRPSQNSWQLDPVEDQMVGIEDDTSLLDTMSYIRTLPDGPLLNPEVTDLYRRLEAVR